MRRILAWILSMTLVVVGLSSCHNSVSKTPVTVKPTEKPKTTETIKPTESPVISIEPTDQSNQKKIVVYTIVPDVLHMLEKFQELHPDFPYEIDDQISRLDTTGIEQVVVEATKAGKKDAPDLFVASLEEMLRFTKGDWSDYVCSYEDLGLDVEKLVKEAEINQYNQQVGLGADGKLRALSYENTQGTYIYRRSIAKKVWGTDEPSVIEKKLGHSWEEFLKAAKELKKKGYAIVSGHDELWEAIAGSANQPWVVDGKLTMDPKREAYLDLAKIIRDNEYDNGTSRWSEEWLLDMAGKGEKSVFGYFGPWWLASYMISEHSGGVKPGEGTYGDWAVCKPIMNFNTEGSYLLVNANSEEKDGIAQILQWMFFDTSEKGLPYLLANKEVHQYLTANCAVASSKVLKQVDATSDFLGGQNPFPIYAELAEEGTAKNVCEYDESLGAKWRQQVKLYADDKISREQAIEAFKNNVKENLGDKIIVE